MLWMWSIMEVPGSLFLLLLFHILTGSTSGTLVTSCDACHDEATCSESQERGDSFPRQALSCVCKDGFVGDGLTCYDTKLCSDSSCCSRGYHWLPDRGCVDTDECSLPDSPCSPSQICYNTPGSFECQRTRSGPSSQSVQFSCGDTLCPLGMDCIGNNELARCADPCEHYTALHDDWRSTEYTTDQYQCDQNVNWQGWYRLFLQQSSAKIPEECIEPYKCGTAAPMWITEPNPTQSHEIVSRTVCSSWSGSCCNFETHAVHVKLCYGKYYVYKLAKPSVCSLAHCAVQHPPILPSQLICGRDKLQVGLHWTSMVSGLNPFSGNLAARNCSWVRVHNDTVWYEVDAQEGACGNTLRTNRTHAIYHNTLFIYPADNSSFAPPLSLPFSCAYPLDTDAHLDVAIRPFLETAGGISGSGTKAGASMSLFRDPNFIEAYPPGPTTLPVGSLLYVGVSVEERDPNFAAVLEDCFATHSSDPDDPTRYPLIQNKCPTDRRQVSVVESGSSLRARFSALFFPLQGEYRGVYLHCSISLCDLRNSSCVPSCRSRAYRSVSHSAPVKPISIGPIIWDKSAE